jgi:hypothetical protein
MTNRREFYLAEQVACNSEGLLAFVAKLAIEQNEFDHFLIVLHEQHSLDPAKFKIKLGEELYNEFLELEALEY